jgi:hypothetical protein
MSVLSGELRRLLERAVLEGRGVAEGAAASALGRLGVGLRDAPGHLSGGERSLRVALRARARQLGDQLERSDAPNEVWVACPLLVSEVAYEQWHRFLFARFLEANGLLHHPEHQVPVSLGDCEELAIGLGEPDGWSVAARFAAEVLPGIFKPSDPSVRVRLAREDLVALEKVVTGLPVEVFTAEDSLGWVYQFWQSKAKDAVNASGRKIGGADLSPVTQLFTENYMVRFLLENSLGAWWAGKYPDSRLLEGYEFLRYDDERKPAAGTFEGWPATVAEVTVMDPCCGSGHFLVAAFGMLWRMRAEAEGLSPEQAQDAVLRDNLFGLELDPRCTQIAMFALALEAWKQGGFRDLPVPQVACSGIPAKAPLSEWTDLAEGDPVLESALARLHALFAEADTLGSLIDPVRAAEDAGLESVDWHDVAPLVHKALTADAKKSGDPAGEVFGEAAAGIARAADYLSRWYTLVATNPPYLGRGKQSEILRNWAGGVTQFGGLDLATVLVQRIKGMLEDEGAMLVVLPDTWRFIPSYKQYRKEFLNSYNPVLIVGLGPRAFSAQLFDYPIGLLVANKADDSRGHDECSIIELGRSKAPSKDLEKSEVARVKLSPEQLGRSSSGGVPLAAVANVFEGLSTGDGGRFTRKHWEQPRASRWERLQVRATSTQLWTGAEEVFDWESGTGVLASDPGARIQGLGAWGSVGVLMERQQSLRATTYCGTPFFKTSVAIVPRDPSLLPAIWLFCRSEEYRKAVRELDPRVGIATSATVKVPFDVERWRAAAAEEFPDGLPEPWSDDATQWLFRGEPRVARQGLQVAVARLVGFRWPEQAPDAVDALVDADGIVCLPPVAGEQSAAERVRAVLAASFGDKWSSAKLDELLVAAGGKPGDLAGWLATTFFKDHCKVFGNRPFVWHIWDGLQDGFSALVNYHRLDRGTLERLTYRTLGWWIDRQKADAESGVRGADARLNAAQVLQSKLQLILDGEPPYDIYVRWKDVAEQPLGWDPDLDDGVRLNIRPFVEAEVLRSKFPVHWKKDRGTNPDGTERHNDVHLTLAEKRKARSLS